MGHAELEGKDPGGKREGLTIRITYNGGKGRMTVNVPEFLRMRRIRRYGRLMALIRQSDTPDTADEVVAYVRRILVGMDVHIQEAAQRAVGTRTAAREMQLEIDRAVARRDRYKRCSDQYGAYSQQVKDLRQSQRILDSLYRGYGADLRAMQRDRDFYQKILAEEDKR